MLEYILQERRTNKIFHSPTKPCKAIIQIQHSIKTNLVQIKRKDISQSFYKEWTVPRWLGVYNTVEENIKKTWHELI